MTSSRLAALLALLSLAALWTLQSWRAPLALVWADEGTYLAMTASLVHDGDLRFDEADRSRLEAAEVPRGDGRATVILQRSDGAVSYSKPILFPLAAAPFYALAGEHGPVALNLVLLGLAGALLGAHLRRLGSPGAAALVLVTFLGASVLLPYVLWRMSDLMQAALVLAGGVLSFAGGRQAPVRGRLERIVTSPAAPWVGAALLGLVVSMRVSNGVLAMVPAMAALLQRRWRRAAGLALATLAAFGLVLALTAALTGATNPYRSARTSFNPATGYPAGPGSAEAFALFERNAASVVTGLEPPEGPRRSLYSSLYFFVGRHTGLLFYFPATLAFAVALLRRRDAVAWAGLAGFAGFNAFFLGWLPWNYFGGETFLGNRYLLPAYALLPALLPRLPGKRTLALAWSLAAVSYGSALFSVGRYHPLDDGSQSHAHAGVFRLLPYESTAQGLAGRRDRYWSDDFVRFVDPFARARKLHFELEAGLPPAELLVATWRPQEALRLQVTTDAPEATLTASDYRWQGSYALGTAAGKRTVFVDLEPSPPWRRHLFWWDPRTLYDARTLRLGLETPDGSAALARVRYLGAPSALAEAFAYELLDDEVPARAAAGARDRLGFTVRNASRRIWKAEDVVPVFARARLDGGGESVLEEGPIPLPRSVAPGEEVTVGFELTWPPAPGEYRLEVDLVLGRVGSFGDRLGKPMLERPVTIE